MSAAKFYGTISCKETLFRYTMKAIIVMLFFLHTNRYMSKELSKFIQAHTIYFWDCPTKNLSSDAILERSINYADLPEIKQLIHIL